jgi:hypothetical protein
VTSRTARVNAARRAAGPDLTALEAEVRRLDAAISAEGAGIEYHQARIEDHEAEQERLGGELHEAVVRLAAASADTAEGRLAAFNRVANGLRNDYATVEKLIDFEDPTAWRRAPSPDELARLDAEAEWRAMMDYLDSGAPIAAVATDD